MKFLCEKKFSRVDFYGFVAMLGAVQDGPWWVIGAGIGLWALITSALANVYETRATAPREG